MLNKALFSFGITALVSTLCGLIFISKFWYVFALAFVLQVLFFYFLNTAYENSLIEKAQKIKEMRKQDIKRSNVSSRMKRETR